MRLLPLPVQSFERLYRIPYNRLSIWTVGAASAFSPFHRVPALSRLAAFPVSARRFGQQAPSPLTSDPPPPTGSFVLFTIIPGCSTGKAMQVKSNAGRTKEGSPIWIGHSLRLPLYSLFL